MSSEPPPPPTVSPDGRFYWDGSRWVPLQPAAAEPPPPTAAQQPTYVAPSTPTARPSPNHLSANTKTLIWAGAIFAVVGIGFGIWYFGFYDTAAGRCSRGDMGACLVYYAESQASASASAAAAQKCIVGPADQSHDVRLVVSGGDNASSDCGVLESHGWANDYVPSGDTQVCSFTLSNGTTVVVWDSGGQYYGEQDCHVLAQDQLPNWTGS